MSGGYKKIEIPVHVDSGSYSTGNVFPLLHEIKHALADYVADGTEKIIDLRSIPMAPGDEEQIIEALGQGEITATLDALGTSEICETQYSGVWLVTHFDQDKKIIGRFIEVTSIPGILLSQQDDVLAALSDLDEKLTVDFHDFEENARHEEHQ